MRAPFFLLSCLLTFTACPVGRGAAPLGASCLNDLQCESVRCSNGCGPNGCADAGVCTRACSTDADCAAAAKPLVCSHALCLPPEVTQ